MNVNKTKEAKLAEMGWRSGTVAEFLGLTPEDSAYIELRLALSSSLRAYRKTKRLTQTQLAKRMESSQSRMAKAEAGDASVSLDLLIQSLLALGATRADLARIIADGGAA